MQDELKTLIEKHFGTLEKLSELQKTDIFLDVYRDLAMVMKRDFNPNPLPVQMGIITLEFSPQVIIQDSPKNELPPLL